LRRALPLLLLLGLATRARAAPDEVGTVLELLEASRLEEAAPLVERHRAEPGLGAFVAGAYDFYRGAYPEAADGLERALASGTLDRMSGEATAFRDLALATAEVTRGFLSKRSAHFEIKVGPKDELLMEPALEALERALAEIGGDLGELPPAVIRVEIYGDITDLAKVSPLTKAEIETSGTIALCKFDRLMATSPRALVAGYPWIDTLSHELTHYLVNRASRNTVPIWLHEGIAKLEEARWREPFGGALPPSLEHLLATGLRDGHLIPFSAMHPSMAKLPSQEDTGLAFAEVTTALQLLTEGRGPSALRKLIATLRDGGDVSRAVASVTGQSFAAFERSWRVWIGKRGYKLHPELGMSYLRFKKDGQKGQKDEEEALAKAPAKNPAEQKARGHVRLGGMLRTRGRLAAAAVEYERAVAILGPGHPEVAGRLGRTYLSLESWDRAIAAAKPGIARRPESAGLRVTVGRALLEKHDAAGARPYLEGALAVNPFDPATRCGLARVYEALIDPRAARERTACTRLEAAP